MIPEDPMEPLPPALRDAAAALPESLEPARDLWPAIRAGIDAERVQALPAPPARPGRSVPLRVAAAAVLVVGVASAGLTAWWRTPPTADPAIVAPASLVSFAAYEESASQLSALYEARASELDPETRAVLERSLAVIDAALQDARAALAREPGNPEARAFVESAYDQKLDFLRRANDVASLRGT